jgi:hypothetical protein
MARKSSGGEKLTGFKRLEPEDELRAPLITSFAHVVIP